MNRVSIVNDEMLQVLWIRQLSIEMKIMTNSLVLNQFSQCGNV